jgi:hypothetical protein
VPWDARSPGALRTLGDVELDLLVLLKIPVALTRDGAEVHEHVRAVVVGDEAVPLVGVELLQRSQFLEEIPSFPCPCQTWVQSDRPPAGSPGRELLEAKTTMINPHHLCRGDGSDSPGVR